MEGGCREANVVECECGSGGGSSLDVLNDVQKAYEHRMDLLDQVPCKKRMPMQVCVLKQWVGDLTAQNSLLARAVEELETEASTRLFLEQRKHSEMVCEMRAEMAVLRRRLARKDSDLRGLVEVLRRLRDFDHCSLDGIHFFEVTESDIFGNCDWHPKKLAQGDLRHNMKHSSAKMKCAAKRDKRCITCGEVTDMKILNDTLRKENCSKEREIRKLHKDAQQYEQTIMALRSEISLCKYHTPDCSKKDAEVMAGMCCTGAECGDWAPVKDFNSVLREEMLSYQERIKKMENNLKSSGEDVRTLRKVNVGLREELHTLRAVCTALDEQARAAALRGHFKDDIIREMRRQLKHAKAKTKEAAELMGVKSRMTNELEPPFEHVTIACVRGARSLRHASRSLSDDGRSPRLVVSGEELEDRCHASTLTNNSDMMQNAMTCTCNIKTPICTPTPNCSRRSLVDCCSDVSIIENVGPQSPVPISRECCDLDEEIDLQCSESCSSNSIRSEPIISCCKHEFVERLNRTCDLFSETSCEETTTCLPTKAGPSTVDLAKDWLSNKTCELKHKIQDLVYSQPAKTCDTKHVDFSSSCKLMSNHSRDPSPCQSVKSRRRFDVSDKLCEVFKHNSKQIPCSPVKSRSYVDIAGKLCELCKHILDPAPCQPVKCKHVDIADKLCENCKHILDSAPGHSGRSCRYCDVANKFCKRCKYIMISNSCEPVKKTSYLHIAEKLCELCKHVLDPAPCQSVKSCRHVDVADKLCKNCKLVLDSVPCESDSDCKHCDISSKLCKQCNNILASTPCQSGNPCKLADITDKICRLCKLVLDPLPCQPDDPCKHCDMTKKMCQDCKRILDAAPCQTDRSCRNRAIADKLCDSCKDIYESTLCQPVKTCKLIDIADKLCELCRHVLDPIPCQPVMSCKHCDITKKLCKDCKRIFDDVPCADRSYKNIDFASKLCQSCKHICDSATCLSIKRCMKHLEIPDKSCEQCELANPCNPDESCKHCDITKKLCKDCKRIFDAVPFKDRSCKNDLANKLCEQCRHIYISTTCSPRNSCIKQETPDKICIECKPSPTLSKLVESCKHCDITKKLCKDCKRIFDAVPCADKSCKNVDFSSKLCDRCRNIYSSAPCQLIESCKNTDIAKLCKHEHDPSSRRSVKSRRLVDIIDRSCERCKHVPDSILCQSVKSCKDVYIQMPEKEEGCKIFEELFFNDRSAGNSSAELWKCEKCACALELQSAETLTTLCPIIEQKTKSTYFDIAKESMCRSSGSSLDSPGSTCASARARYYQNKLLATLQILQTKEETVLVQAESLTLAESRIAALNARHTDLRREIERKEREIQSLRKSLTECKKCKMNSCVTSLTEEIQEMDVQKNVVKTLQNNLGVIEDLYRECFYESVKQENLIEMLRESYLDVRLMDKEKSDRISKLHNVINAQKWSLDRCQDIAAEVDDLKVEISNFINSSNNDSGVWEESVVGGLNEDLQDIAVQLLRLKDLLTGDCTCGLGQENVRLRKENERLQGDICGLHAQISALEENLRKNECLDRQFKEQIEIKERELNCIRGQMHALMESTKEKTTCCDSLKQTLTETKDLLDIKATELCCVQKQCRDFEDLIKVMKEELCKSEHIAKENEARRAELCCVSRRAARVERRAADLEGELARAREHCQRVEAAYREKTSNAAELERELDAAHARGAELCGEARRVVRAVRCWAARMKDMHREQEKQIKQKECKLHCLQSELHKRQISICPRLWEQMEQNCSAPRLAPCASAPSTSAASSSKSPKRNEGSCPTVTFCMGERGHDGTTTSESEIASCSSSPVPPCPAGVPSGSNVPPRLPNRTCKKKQSARILKRHYSWLGEADAVAPEACATRCDADTRHATCGHYDRMLPDATPQLVPMSPGEEMFSRMESLRAALADGCKRWSRRAPP